jgi:hypothetical protein
MHRQQREGRTVDTGQVGTSQQTASEGCAVDWSWLVGREITSARSDLQSFLLTFADGQTLTVHAAMYDGKAFLSFTPWKQG